MEKTNIRNKDLMIGSLEYLANLLIILAGLAISFFLFNYLTQNKIPPYLWVTLLVVLGVGVQIYLRAKR